MHLEQTKSENERFPQSDTNLVGTGRSTRRYIHRSKMEEEEEEEEEEEDKTLWK